MGQPTQEDVDRIDSLSYNAELKGTALGFTDVGSLEIVINGKVITKKVDQLAAEIAKAKFKGFDMTVNMTLVRTDPEFVAGVVLEGAFGIRPGGQFGDTFGVGDKPQDVKTSMAGELILVPTINAVGDRSNSFRIHLAYGDTSAGITLIGSQDDFQTFAISFKVLPDLLQASDFRYAEWGNIDNPTGVAPLGIIIQCGQQILTPTLSLEALDLEVDGKQQLTGVIIPGTASTTNTALLNDIAGIDDLAATQTVPFDTLLGPAFAVGVYVLLGGIEAVRIKANDGTNLTVTRGALGIARVAHADNATIEVIDFLRFLRATQALAWTSSDASVTVGNSPGLATDNQKGKIVWQSTGSANIKASILGTDSPLLVVTAN